MPLDPYVRVTKDAIAELIQDRQPEDRTLEYKQALPGTTADDRNEFLADVTAMANTSGGVILYGVEEERIEGETTARPKSILGLPGVKIEEHRHRMEQWLKTNVAPNIPGVHVYAVDGAAESPVLVVQTPRSWSAPHLVKNGRWVGFFNRGSVGKREMDWHNIRGGFAAGEGERERIERFRSDRVGKIASDSLGFDLSDPSRLIMHIVPLGAVSGPAIVDVRAAHDDWHRLMPVRCGGCSRRPVFEGLLVYSSGNDRKVADYTLLFREGIIETVHGGFARKSRSSHFCVAGTAFEKDVLEVLPRLLSELNEQGCAPPVLVMLSACGVRGAIMAGDADPATWRSEHPIDRDVLCFAPVVFDSFDTAIDRAMKPAFDAIWNAAGWPGSANYDGNGNWNGAQR